MKVPSRREPDNQRHTPTYAYNRKNLKNRVLLAPDNAILRRQRSRPVSVPLAAPSSRLCVAPLHGYAPQLQTMPCQGKRDKLVSDSGLVLCQALYVYYAESFLTGSSLLLSVVVPKIMRTVATGVDYVWARLKTMRYKKLWMQSMRRNARNEIFIT